MFIWVVQVIDCNWYPCPASYTCNPLFSLSFPWQPTPLGVSILMSLWIFHGLFHFLTTRKDSWSYLDFEGKELVNSVALCQWEESQWRNDHFFLDVERHILHRHPEGLTSDAHCVASWIIRRSISFIPMFLICQFLSPAPCGYFQEQTSCVQTLS